MYPFFVYISITFYNHFVSFCVRLLCFVLFCDGFVLSVWKKRHLLFFPSSGLVKCILRLDSSRSAFSGQGSKTDLLVRESIKFPRPRFPMLHLHTTRKQKLKHLKAQQKTNSYKLHGKIRNIKNSEVNIYIVIITRKIQKYQDLRSQNMGSKTKSPGDHRF